MITSSRFIKTLLILSIWLSTLSAYGQSVPVTSGLAWLRAAQNPDGSWGTMSTLRDTTTVLDTYKLLGIADSSNSNAAGWLGSAAFESNDYLARRTAFRAGTGADVSEDIQTLVSYQNPSGGWGYYQGYGSNVYDTVIVLHALQAAQYQKPTVINPALTFLMSRQLADGSWSVLPEASGDAVTTALAITILKKYALGAAAAPAITRGIAWLNTKQNPDGGYGSSPSTIQDTAYALTALMMNGSLQASSLTNAIIYISASQHADGSWNQSPFETALAVKTLSSLKPNPSIFLSDLSLSNLNPKSGESVVIRAEVRNTGGTASSVIPVKFFSEGPDHQRIQLGDTQIIPALAVGGSFVLETNFNTRDRQGVYQIIVSIDPDNSVAELTKEDNLVSAPITITPVSDLVIANENIALSENPLNIGEDVTITATVSNQGNLSAQHIAVQFYHTSVIPANLIGNALISELRPGETTSRQATWKTSVVGQDIRIFAVIDPLNTVNELSDSNNQAFQALTVLPVTDPNLTVSYKDIMLSPAIAEQGGAVQISALIKNEGFSQADSVAVECYNGLPGSGGQLLGSTVLPAITPAGSAPVSFTWTDIPVSGERIIFIKVDPANTVLEFNETDNEDFVVLPIKSLPDLAISTNAIVFSPAAPRDGDPASINITVKNLGEQPAANVTVTAEEASGAIGSQTVPAIPGNSQAVVTIPYVTTGKTGAHLITVVVDPDNQIREQGKENNRAAKTLGIQNADLWLTEQYISPNGDGVKDSTQFFFRLESAHTVQVAIVNAKGAIIRSFSGPEFENTAAGEITWDGLDNFGIVVEDGQYHIQIMNSSNSILGSLPVMVDTNRSPLTDALGTKYLQNNNLTCMLPDIWDWRWSSDESGIVFSISNSDQNTPEYPNGIYAMAPDGQDVLRLAPWETEQNTKIYYIYEPSPDGEKVAMIIDKHLVLGPWNWVWTSNQLWVVDRDGRNMTLLGSMNPTETGNSGFRQIKWSSDSFSLIHLGGDTPERAISVMKPDGTGKLMIDPDGQSSEFYDLKSSPDGTKMAYVTSICDPNTCVQKLRIADMSGLRNDVFDLPEYGSILGWMNDHTVLLAMRDPNTWNEVLWLVDATNAGGHVRLSEGIEDSYGQIVLSPDAKSVAFVEPAPDFMTIKVGDAAGNSRGVYKAPTFRYSTTLADIRWSQDSTKLAFVDYAYEKVNECLYRGAIVTVNLRTNEVKAMSISDITDTCEIPASYHIMSQAGGSWVERGVLHYGSSFLTQELDLTMYLKNSSSPYRLRISQTGLDAAHIDSVALRVNGKEYNPSSAKNVSTGEDLLGKVRVKDHDVADAHNASIEFTWDAVPQGGRIALVLNGREENLSARDAEPFRYPVSGYYSVPRTGGSSLTVDGKITAADDLSEPLFSTYTRPATGHPNGYTYGYVKTDGEYLYGVLDFTPDNTVDSGRDWAGIEIMTAAGPKMFKVTRSDTQYGQSSFTTSDTVSYQHNVYEFKLPLSEIKANPDQPIQLAFHAYGTAGGSGQYYYQRGSLQWLADGNSLLAEDNHGIFSLNSATSEKIYLPIEGSNGQVSPLGRYITYNQPATTQSVCYGRGYSDTWAMSSLLNLTADLRAQKQKSAVILKGTAVDLNFAGYQLEYADVKTPASWNLVTPPSDVPVINDVFTTWVPPYEGTFIVRLSVNDTAGNTATMRRRVSWGLSSSITNLYKTLDLFSPNGDGVKDSVELHYRVLEPVHLEFSVLDGEGIVLKTFARDYTSPTDDHITWDGRDSSGQVVPDGKYTIRVFDYEFFVEADATPPDSSLFISPLVQAVIPLFSGVPAIQAYLVGHALDHNFKSWSLEYGIGEFPQEWHELSKSTASLKNPKPDPVPFAQSLSDAVIRKIYTTDINEIMNGMDLEWLVNKRLRIVAEDFAGNRSIHFTDLFTQSLILYKWDGIPIELNGLSSFAPTAIPPDAAQPRTHALGGVETVRIPVAQANIMYSQDFDAMLNQWVNWKSGPAILNPGSGLLTLSWDTALLDQTKPFAVVIRAVDAEGTEHFSNMIEDRLFSIKAVCEPHMVSTPNPASDRTNTFLLAQNFALGDISRLTLLVQSDDDIRYADWTPFLVFDTARGDVIPRGEFYPPMPPVQSGAKYQFAMAAVTPSQDMVSEPAKYPKPGCIGMKVTVKPEEAACGEISNTVKISAEKNDSVGVLVYTKLDYYLEKEPGKLELLKEFDLADGGLPELTLDTSSIPEGKHVLHAIITVYNPVDKTTLRGGVDTPLVVDRVLPTARITYPDAAQAVCPVVTLSPDGDWTGIPVEGIAKDTSGTVAHELYYAIGSSDIWAPADTKQEKSGTPIKGGTLEGQIGVWDITPFRESAFGLKLKVVDQAGNTSCTTTNFSVRPVTQVAAVRSDLALFSPNDDGLFDSVTVSYDISDYATVSAQVFKLIDGKLDTTPVRTIASGLQHIGGTGTIAWDGKNNAGSVVPDGKYGIVVSASDSCNAASRGWAQVEVDATPPVVAITYPKPGDPLGTVAEVSGTAADPHFQSFVLETGQGDTPETWATINASSIQVLNNVLGKWNTFGRDGRWTIRLTALDTVGNKNFASVTIDLGTRKTLIKDLGAAPRLFSPNGDNKLETTLITYELTDTCDITIEMIDIGGVVRKRQVITGRIAGVSSLTWDGKDDANAPVSDGPYTVKLTAVLSSNNSVTQTESITTIIDTTLPRIDIRQPAQNAYIPTADVPVSGSIGDLSLIDYTIMSLDSTGSSLLDHGNESHDNYTFGTLNELAEGAYSLTVQAKDLGENSDTRTISFVIDRTPPKVVLETPKQGEYFGSGKNTIVFTGSIAEANFDAYVLRYGAGDDPASWTNFVTGTTIPLPGTLFTWNVGKNDGVPDGLYTLSYHAKDKAGLIGEARVRVVVDNTLPTTSIITPQEGSYIKTANDVIGTAYDQNLEKYTIDISEGQCSSAVKWNVLKTATDSVQDNVLIKWQALPPDDDYCLRVTAQDKLGNTAESKVTVKVDTHPPAPPVLSGTIENKSSIRLTWVRNSEPDMVGYNVYRGGQKINTALITDLTYLDENLAEGLYLYTLTAVDLAGWESKPSGEIRLQVDLTPPTARIRAPQDNLKVSGLADIEIKGTAFSFEDFKQYRVFIGQGANPAAWSLIRTSPVPVSYGALAQWNTIGIAEGPYSIKLEAEDISGNVETHTISVTIDNLPPAAPLVISGVSIGSDVTITWNPNTEADLAGYLLYRNDQLANTTGIVIGDLKPYLVSGSPYPDKALPDGMFRYYLLAMDQAGNLSDQSNTVEVTVDTRPPHATIVEPIAGSSFEHKIFVKAESPDLDIDTVQFQYRSGSGAWASLGSAITRTPFVMYLDPVGMALAYGTYQVQALATDKAGKTDPAPAPITLTYTDLTAPAVPQNFTARTNGDAVSLTWSANTETDLAGYNIYRTSAGGKAKVNQAILTAAHYEEAGIADGAYSYEITAADAHGNESGPSASAESIVYAPGILQPFTPTSAGSLEIHGAGAISGSSVQLFVNGTSQATAPALADGTFQLNAALIPGENTLSVTASDANGNTSRSSETVFVVYNEPPAIPTGLTNSVLDFAVNLTWTPNTEQDLAGYNLYRNGNKVNAPVAVSGTASASASYDLYSYPPAYGADSDPNTYWMSPYGYGVFSPVWWQIDLPAPELINQVDVLWISAPDYYGNTVLYAGKDFEIQVWSGNAWITQSVVKGNNTKTNTFRFEPSYRTDKIRIAVTDTTDPGYPKQVWLAEVTLQKDNLITQSSFDDLNLTDGNNRYSISAVDYYGFESGRSEETNAGVGDVTAPSAPQGFSGTPSDSSVILSWSTNPEPDMAGYNVYRNTPAGWIKLNSVLVTGITYTDPNLTNGSYSYRATAVDMLGNESIPSAETSVTVQIAVLMPPSLLSVSAPPEGRILRPAWAYQAGAAGYNLYRSLTSDGPYTKVTDIAIVDTVYLDGGLTNGIPYYYVVTALDHAGNESAFSIEVMGIPGDQTGPDKPVIFLPTMTGQPVTSAQDRTDIFGTSEPASLVELFGNGTSLGRTTALVEDTVRTYTVDPDSEGGSLSFDGRTLAYERDGSIWLQDLKTNSLSMIIQQAGDPVWSPSGNTLAYRFTDAAWNDRIGIYDRITGSTTPLTGDSEVNEYHPSWSSDGTKIVFGGYRNGIEGIWIRDFAADSLRLVLNSGNIYNYKLSPDGNKLAYFENQNLHVLDLASTEPTLVHSSTDSYSIDWSRDSGKLAFIVDNSSGRNIQVSDLSTGNQVQVTNGSGSAYQPTWSADGLYIYYDQYDDATSSEMLVAAPVGMPGPPRIIQSPVSLWYLMTTGTGELAYIDSGTLKITRLAGQFNFTGVPLHAGENVFTATASDLSGNGSVLSDPVTISFNSASMPDLALEPGDLFLYPSYPVSGEQMSINIGVRNTSPVEVRDVEVSIYVWNALGALEHLKTQRISAISPQSAEFIPATWNSAGKTGENRIVVVVDPEDNIAELIESNNMAIKDFRVVGQAGLGTVTTLESDQYTSSQNVPIRVSLWNSGPNRDVVLETVVEDENGYPVYSFDPVTVSLPYGADQVRSMLWNTGSTFAGAYRVHTLLKDSAGVPAENVVPFTIAPDAALDVSIVTDKAVYGPREDVRSMVTIRNIGNNAIIPSLSARITILDPAGAILLNEDKTVTDLLPNAKADLAGIWNTGLNTAGDYQAKVEVTQAGQPAIIKIAAFKVASQSAFIGTLKAIPAIVHFADNVQLNYSITNTGSADASGIAATVFVFDPESLQTVRTQDLSLDLFRDETKTGQVTFSAVGLGLKPYVAVLQYTYAGTTANLANTSFTVKDLAPPMAVISGTPASPTNSTSAVFTISGANVITYRFKLDDGNYSAETAVSSPITLSALSDATHTLSVVGKNSSGLWQPEGDATFASWTIDTRKPVLMLSTLPDNSYTKNATLNIAGTVTDNLGIQNFTINNEPLALNPDGTFSYAITLVAGGNAITATATDTAGNITMDFRTIILDQTMPILTIAAPADNSATNTAETTVTGTVDESSTVLIKLNEGSPVPATMTGNTFSLPMTLIYGLNTIEVLATDQAGNTSAGKRTVTYDNLMPSLAITNPAEDITINDAVIMLQGTVSDLTSLTVTVNFDGTVYTPLVIDGAFQQQLTFTTEKMYAVIVTATDTVGNTTTVQRNIIYDLVPPVFTINSATSPTNQNSQVITGTREEASIVDVTCPTATVGIVAYPTSTTWEVFLTDLIVGENMVTVTATDIAGNPSNPVNATIILDIDAPVSTAAPASGVYGPGLVIVLTTTEAATIHYTTDGSLPTAGSPVYAGPISAPDSVLVRFFAVDAAGNIEAVKNAAYTIDAIPPTGSISINNGDLYTRTPSVFLTAGCADTLSGCAVMQFSNDNTTWSIPEAYAVPKEWQLTPGEGLKTVYARYQDAVGNLSGAYSAGITVDTIPPMTTASPAGGYFNTQQTVSLLANEPATIFYTLDGSIPTATSPQYTGVITIAETATLQFFASDLAGNNEFVTSITYTIDAELPVLAVSTLPDGAYTNNATLNIAGTASDNVGVYGVTINNTSIPVNDDGSFSAVLTLSAGANTIITSATDKAGNISSDSRTIILDQTGPVLTITAPADNSATNVPEATVTGTVDETSDVAITVNGGTPVPVTMAGNTFSVVVTLASGQNTIEVTATDLASNASTGKRTVIYDNQVPALAITNPAQDITTNEQSILLTGTVSDLTDLTVTIEFNGQIYTPAVTSGAFEQMLAFTEEKTYAVIVTATDAVGNTITVQRNIIYQVQPPTTEETTLAYTGPLFIAKGKAVALSGSLKVNGTAPPEPHGQTITFTLGAGSNSQSCTGTTDAYGRAVCAIDPVTVPIGATTVTAVFSGDAYYQPSSDSKNIVIFGHPAIGTFVIGDKNSAMNNRVTFWGAQWWWKNSLTGGQAPAAFKGFADNPSTNPPMCGGTWYTDPGNCSDPPASVPEYMAVIVASKITKSGMKISGNIQKIVIVKTDPGYGPNPGHAGTGTVVGVICP